MIRAMFALIIKKYVKIYIIQYKCRLINRLLPVRGIYATEGQIFYFNLRRDHKKNSYERRDYESVDEKSLS